MSSEHCPQKTLSTEECEHLDGCIEYIKKNYDGHTGRLENPESWDGDGDGVAPGKWKLLGLKSPSRLGELVSWKKYFKVTGKIMIGQKCW